MWPPSTPPFPEGSIACGCIGKPRKNPSRGRLNRHRTACPEIEPVRDAEEFHNQGRLKERTNAETKTETESETDTETEGGAEAATETERQGQGLETFVMTMTVA